MYYITSFNQNQRKYCTATETQPHLRNHPTFSPQLLTFFRAPALEAPDLAYTTFRIPKASGGFRIINAPSEPLKTRQRTLITHLQKHCKIIESPWAFAYVKETCAVDALKVHQRNNSQWFLKIDIKDFFPSCTQAAVQESLSKLFPICAWDETDKQAFFDTLNQYCYHEGCLPQGAVSSPYLSNLVMTAYDYEIFKLLSEARTFERQKYVYTRYADDILISAKNQFNWQEIQDLIQILLNPHFTLKTAKTRYGSRQGRNWNLGCMLNADNNITTGHRTKEDWKRKMMDIIIRHRNNEPIPLEEKQQLMGNLSYYKMIEPDYFNYLNRHYMEKYHVNFEAIIRPTL